MSPEDRLRAAERRRASVALVATLAIQSFTALAVTSIAVLAPVLAGDLGVPPTWIGVFVGIVYAGAMTASLASGGAIGRFGPIRVSQACVLMCVAGIAAIAALPVGAEVALVVAAIVIGFGYGPITPASSQVLARTAPPERMALTFSIKQTGVPAGAAIAGAVLPSLALSLGWRGALGAVAAVGAAIAFASQPVRADLDSDRRRDARITRAAIAGPLTLVLRSPRLLELSLVGFAYSATQTCLLGFLVVHLTDTLHWSLVGAGLGLTCATVAGVAGRIGWGVVADRTGAPRRVLAMLGGVATACSVLLALAQPAWPTLAVLALAAVFGGTAIGWNGVQLAEVAREAPPGKAGAITGASGFITFAGVVSGPPLFALLASLTGGYRAGFAMTALLSLTCATAVWLRSRADPARATSDPQR